MVHIMTIDSLIDQTLGTRQTIVKLLKSIPNESADVIPPTWTNNARWHAGHLIVTPYLVTFGVLKETNPIIDSFRNEFGKGTDPTQWEGKSIPSYEDLVDDIVPSAGRLFDLLKDRIDQPYIEPYMTSVGIALHSPRESLQFSLMHDGIHLGMLLALRRALQIQSS